MLNVLALAVVIMFPFLFLSGCSGPFGDQRKEAEDVVTKANGAIAEHNRLFDQARESYGKARKQIEDGEKAADQKDDIAKARQTLQKASNSLRDAETRMENVQEMDVDPVIQRYATLLSKAMDAQLSAEASEIEFYGVMGKDPALTENRERALKILSRASDDYEKAEDFYAKARELASSNPDVIKLPPATKGESNPESQESAPDAPKDQSQDSGSSSGK
ncbi:MAG: hypothetical protein ACR2HO_10145 [Rubrobacteraceae bacterium]|nr:hypothetical protein [Rubrobacter sp.]